MNVFFFIAGFIFLIIIIKICKLINKIKRTMVLVKVNFLKRSDKLSFYCSLAYLGKMKKKYFKELSWDEAELSFISLTEVKRNYVVESFIEGGIMIIHENDKELVIDNGTGIFKAKENELYDYEFEYWNSMDWKQYDLKAKERKLLEKINEKF